jgi:hypothetical protein
MSSNIHHRYPADGIYLRSVLQVLNEWDPAGVKPALSGRPLYYEDCAVELVENLLGFRDEIGVQETLESYMVRSYGFSQSEITERSTAAVIYKLFTLPY